MKKDVCENGGRVTAEMIIPLLEERLEIDRKEKELGEVMKEVL
jgi:hypothetical protein